MNLHHLADSLNTDLGPPFHIRREYDFAFPSKGGVSVGRADAAIFSSAVPSLHTAAIGFHSTDGMDAHAVDTFAYLGAPFLVSETRGYFTLFKFSANARAQKIDERKSSDWIRDHILRDVESKQLLIPFAATRELLIQNTRNALEKIVSALMERAKNDKHLDEADSFRVAIAAMRHHLSLPAFAATPLARSLFQYAESLARAIPGRLSFANVPVESIAEMYQKLAVGEEDRRRRGVVYTPAWLARYVVDCLPSEAFSFGRALDPACGSGTFMVCFLERVAERANREGRHLDAKLLRQSICGIDIDLVAIEAARLSLDMCASAMGISAVSWDLSVANATVHKVEGEWLIGNLPFGYRTHQGRSDLSSVILEQVHKTDSSLRALSLILPDSLAYAASARTVRTILRSNYYIQAVTRLPESIFSKAATMVLTARKDVAARSLPVRQVREQDLPRFKAGAHLANAFYSEFPSSLDAPWLFTPFSREFQKAAETGRSLDEIAQVRGGLQIYGVSPLPIGGPLAKPSRPLLMEPTTFAGWTPGAIRSLPTLTAEREQVRRAGPWEGFAKPKVIVRATTPPAIDDRLAAIPDTQGVWFTDKFVGIWPRNDALDIRAIAAYLQTRFARVWYEANNPSRKLRVRSFGSLPVPHVTEPLWEHAAALAMPDTVIRPLLRGESLMFKSSQEKEWAAFDAAVEDALGLEPSTGALFDRWLDARLSPALYQEEEGLADSWEEYRRFLAVGSSPLERTRSAQLETMWESIIKDIAFAPAPQAALAEDGTLVLSWDRGSHHLEIEMIADGLFEWFYMDVASSFRDSEEGLPIGTVSPAMRNSLARTFGQWRS